MRIWSLHPQYLDAKGLVASWREALLAKNVLSGNTKGYRNRPQLNRFKKAENPVAAIDRYLSFVYKEAVKRGYNFNRDKINWHLKDITIIVSTGQIEYEFQHLLRKLKMRDKDRYNEIKSLKKVETHPMLRIIEGEIENWEKVIEKI